MAWKLGEMLSLRLSGFDHFEDSNNPILLKRNNHYLSCIPKKLNSLPGQFLGRFNCCAIGEKYSSHRRHKDAY